ncbi:unnamed protein product [Adineta ricciae]|uniref:ascorbate ferrireductase (transmembrane) n=1 Tax=Adineta ricciae TaxID=249248 RepID=A0A815B661_ADIRI|nr:unnamed protein product [Adineta ricciae]
MPLTLTQVHGLVMVIGLMIFASTGVLFARYGRSIRFGNRRQLLGKAIWFQIHRFLLSISSVLTLLGFLLILVRKGGQWANLVTSDIRAFIHSIFGGIIVCCTMVQVWLALYRCHPQSRYRYIFDWSHRIVGLTVFILVIPTIFLISDAMSRFRPNLVPIFSCWMGWIVIVVLVLERIQYKQRSIVMPLANSVQTADTKEENGQRNVRQDTETATSTNNDHRRYDRLKLVLLLCHFLVTNVISIVFIVYICS